MGLIYLNEESYGGGGSGGGTLTPVYSEGTKIADYTTASGNTELYIPNTEDKDPAYQNASSAGYVYFYTVKKVGIWSGDFHKSYTTQTINTCVDRDIYEVTFIARSSSSSYSTYVEYTIPLHSDNTAKYASSGSELGAEYNFIPLHVEALVHMTNANTWISTTPTITMNSTYDTATATIPSQGSGTSGYFNAVVIKIRYVG